MRALIAPALVAALGACGPAWAPANAPTIPCATITQAEFEAALDAGAARGTARIHESGMADITNGPGVQHCATFNGAMRPCRRPNEYVIDYTTVEGEHIYVRVPANAEYRLNVRSRPHTCELIQ
ncbi:MAG: hypothetical protein K2X34_00575 [Hyphomonadaceae bacterium]|nr:hypothetical protein [Hyphomonadaceae bacterium]